MSTSSPVATYQIEPIEGGRLIALKSKFESAPIKVEMNTTYAERIVRALSPELGIDASSNLKITSVLFMNGPGRRAQSGALLCTDGDQPLVYVYGALLGYDGNGPLLSKVVLQSLGLPESAFTEANDQMREHSQRYALRVTIG